MAWRRSSRYLGLAMWLAAASLVVPDYATAAGPNSISGLMWKDLNASGQLGDTDPTQFGLEAEGPMADIEVSIDGPGGAQTTTTGADGLYSFDDLNSGTYTLSVSYPAGYRPGPVGPDGQITGSSAPASGSTWSTSMPVVLTSNGEVIINGAVLPLAALSIDIADLDTGPGVTPAVQTGRPSFDTLGLCATISDPPTPGDDCAWTDAYVRTNDLTTMTFSVGADGIIDPTTSPLEDVVVEQTLTPSATADIKYNSLPNQCLTSDVNPASSITESGDGSSLLTCNMGPFQNELKLLSVSLKALGTSANGSTFATTERVYQAQDSAIPVAKNGEREIVISAAPRFDITIGNSTENPYNRTIYGQTKLDTNQATGVEEYGVVYYYDISVLYDGAGIGNEALADPITFSFVMDSAFHGWTIRGCHNTPYPRGKMPTDDDGVQDWGERGTWDCSANYTDDQIDVMVSDVDTDGDPIPTAGDNGTDLSAGPYIAFAGRLNVWFPLSEFYQQVDPTWEYGDDPILGDYTLTNQIENFDPLSVSGLSNYGSGTELETNNVKSVTLDISSAGGFTTHIGAYDWADDQVSATFSNDSTHSCTAPDVAEGSLIQGQTDHCDAGDGPIQPGQKMSLWYWLRNDGSIPWPSETYELCYAFDNSTMKLTQWSFGDYITIRNPTVPDEAIIIEYATGNFGDDIANGDWTSQASASEGCNAPLNDWTTNPTSLGIDNIGMVRVRVDEQIYPEVGPSEYLQVAVPTEARSNYYGGPNDGTPIEVGVVLGSMTNRAYSTIPYFSSAGQTYQPATNEHVGHGDRAVFNRHQVRIATHTSQAVLGDDLIETVEAGDQILWSLHPSVTASSTGALAPNVVITDVLPQYVDLDPVCQAAQPLPAGVTLTSAIPGPGTGETTLTFDLGDRYVNESIAAIPICTITSVFAPPSTVVLNSAQIQSDTDVSPEQSRTDERAVSILQRGAFTVGKTVDSPVELQNRTQTWTIGWQNLSESLPFAPPDAIDVLPYNGDFENDLNGRFSYGTAHVSTIGLQAALPQPTTTDGNGVQTVTGGTWYYSDEDPANISHDARDSSNDFGSGSTNWCDEASLTSAIAPCDFPYASASAIRFASSGDLNPNDTVAVNYTTAAGTANGTETVSNQPGDRYVNRFAAFSTTFPNQLVRSREVVVQVMSLSIGDLVFRDVDVDGKYTAGIDQPIAGVDVELRNSSGYLVNTLTTNAAGRYVFLGLAEGEYEVTIPSAEFLSGGPLVGHLPTILPTPANNDGNEGVDQQARPGSGGAVISGLVSLNPDITVDPPIGREPTGEDVTGIESPLTYDNFSNLSVDMGLVGDPDIEILKEVCVLDETSSCEEATPTHWAPSTDAPTSIPFIGVWRITVTNTGLQMLGSIEVTDPLASNCNADSNDVTALGAMLPGDSVRYVCTTNSLASSLTNTATASATSSDGSAVSDSHSAAIEAPAASPSIEVVKFVVGLDANLAPGPGLVSGDPLSWTYQVTNAGNIAFNDVNLVDDNGTASDDTDDTEPSYQSGDANSNSTLDVGETWLYSLAGTVTDGPYVNLAEATGTGIWGSQTWTTDNNDAAHHFGAAAEISVIKRINGHDANDLPGIGIAPGTPASFTYEVTNSGNTYLSEVLVEDDQGVAVTCPKATLSPTETMICTGSEIATGGPYESVATSTGRPSALDGSGQLAVLYNASGDLVGDVSADDPANYYGAQASIDIVKYINGNDANTAPGVMLPALGPANWTYVVTNTGNTALIDVGVADDQGLTVTCPASQLGPGASMTCAASGSITIGDYRNVGLAVGTPAAAGTNGSLVALINSVGAQLEPVSDNDPANNFGFTTGLNIKTRVYGFDAPIDEAVHTATGSTAPYTYEVSNTGNTWLDEIVVTDSLGNAVSCPQQSLAPGAAMTCTSFGKVAADAVRTLGSVTGSPSLQTSSGLEVLIDATTGLAVTKPVDDDDANLFGEEPELTLDKMPCYEDKCGSGIAVPSNGVITWVITIKNTGNVSLANVTVTDPLVEACDRSVGSLDPGQSTTVECQAKASVTTKNQAKASGNTVSHIPTGPSILVPAIASNLTVEDSAYVSLRTNDLAHTGTNLGFLFAIGSWMLALGSGLLWSTRRRRSAT